MKKLILIFALAFGFTAQAQEKAEQTPYIEVTGTSETEVTPDEITIAITLQESKERPNIQNQEERLIRAVMDLGIDISNLTLNSADADYQKVKLMKKEVVVSKSYLLKLTNADMVGKVYAYLSELDAQDAYISKVNYSKMEELKKENRIKAIKDAKDKAEYLLAAIGHKPGTPMQIYEQQNGIVNPIPYRANAKLAMAYSDMSESTPEISFRKIKIVNTFYIKYEIE